MPKNTLIPSKQAFFLLPINVLKFVQILTGGHVIHTLGRKVCLRSINLGEST